MIKIFEYIAFRIFEYYSKKDNSLPILSTMAILYFYQLIIILYILNILNKFNIIDKIDIPDASYKIKYFFTSLVSLLFYFFNKLIYGKKLQGEKYKKLYKKYHKKKYCIHIMVIFFAPPFFVFVVPMIYGWVNGTLIFNLPKNW